MNQVIYILFLLLCPIVLPAQTGNHKPQWITCAESQNTTNQWVAYRREFQEFNIPKQVYLKIAADTKYWFWINGELVVFEGGVKRGPTPQDTYYDKIDVAPFLKEGKNTFAFLVWYFGKDGFSHNSSGKAGLFVESLTNNLSQINSNRHWKSILHPAYQTAAYPLPNYRLPESNILFDARVDYINGWQTSHFDDTAWRRSKELGEEGTAPWNMLRDRVIPQWKDHGLQAYVSIERREGQDFDTLVCKLPYNAQVTPYFKIEASAGEKICMKTDHYVVGNNYNIRGEYITKTGVQEYESLGWMNGHEVIYLVPKSIHVIDLQYRETSYNTAFTGNFTCNDAFLNKLWEKTQRTLLVNMRDTYMDCPDRERAQWWADVVNSAAASFYAFCPSSHLLMKKGMYELIGWQRSDGTIYSPVPSSNFNRELPGQMLASIGYYGFWNYYMHTGDIHTIKELYDGVKKYLQVWKLHPNGTLNVRRGDWYWGDWGTNIDKQALINLWYHLALKGVCNMAKVLEYESDVEEYTKKIAIHKHAFNTSFWDGENYKHTAYAEDIDDRVQALAVVAGIADSTKYPLILDVLRQNQYASPYMEKYVIEALFKMGYDLYAIERLKKRYAIMVNDTSSTTLYELWEKDDKSLNHAWSAGGLTVLSQYACGVIPVTAGYKTFKVYPYTSGLSFARSTTSTVKGDILVSWTKRDSDLELSVSVPESTTSLIGIPNANLKIITCNEITIWRNGKFVKNKHIKHFIVDNDRIQFTANAGNYIFKTTCK